MTTVRIKILKSVGAQPWNMAHFVGDDIECETKQAALLVESGRAAYISAPVETATATVQPETATAKPQRKRK
jgi:hypothetical protein